MNKLFLFIAISFSLNIFAQDTAKSAALLNNYYALTDALVKGNATQAAAYSAAFQKAAGSIEVKKGSEGSITQLVKDAAKIAGATDLKKQREIFAGLSTNMTTLAKANKLSDKPVYLAYCPMKKASWLSKEKAIKNPYYGSSMLTCGEITETIQ